jgi:hypothetical protein
MNDMMDYLFGPLSTDYCLYFYFLSIFGFLLLVIFLFSSLFYGIARRKGVDFYISVISVSIGYAVFYFQNRLLHTMCVSK